MALRDQPYFPLYVQDFLTDEKLNMCSASAQGVYIKLMCLFHKSEPYGGILLKQKDKQNSSTYLNFAYKLAKLLPFDLPTISDAITELIDEGVLCHEDDFLYQKRMVKDNKISELRSVSGKVGGLKMKEKIDQFAQAKDEAKSKQNTEYENEYESEVEYEIDSEKKKPISEIFISTIPDEWRELIAYWLDYKKDRRENYKSLKSLTAMYHKLVKLSDDDLETAKQIIEVSVANNYAGFFELKTPMTNGKSKRNNVTKESIERIVDGVFATYGM